MEHHPTLNQVEIDKLINEMEDTFLSITPEKRKKVQIKPAPLKKIIFTPSEKVKNVKYDFIDVRGDKNLVYICVECKQRMIKNTIITCKGVPYYGIYCAKCGWQIYIWQAKYYTTKDLIIKTI